MGTHLGTQIVDSKPVESALALAPQRSRPSNPRRERAVELEKEGKVAPGFLPSLEGPFTHPDNAQGCLAWSHNYQCGNQVKSN